MNVVWILILSRLLYQLLYWPRLNFGLYTPFSDDIQVQIKWMLFLQIYYRFYFNEYYSVMPPSYLYLSAHSSFIKIKDHPKETKQKHWKQHNKARFRHNMNFFCLIPLDVHLQSPYKIFLLLTNFSKFQQIHGILKLKADPLLSNCRTLNFSSTLTVLGKIMRHLMKIVTTVILHSPTRAC